MSGRTEQIFGQDLQGLWLKNDGMMRRVERLTNSVTQNVRDVWVFASVCKHNLLAAIVHKGFCQGLGIVSGVSENVRSPAWDG